MPTLPRITATNDTTVTQDSHNNQIYPKAARNRRHQGIANIRSGGLLPRKHSPDGAAAHIRLNGPTTHLSTSEYCCPTVLL